MIERTSYSEMIVIERLRGLNDWWPGMEEFATLTGYSTSSVRAMLDRLCKRGVATKLVDKLGEGYYLNTKG